LFASLKTASSCDASDCNGHGTHVAGTIGGNAYGVAKGVRLVGVRVLDCAGYGSYSGIIAAIDWVTANAQRPAVVNLSLGGSPSEAVDEAVRRSIASGITYAVAAGNSGADACGASPARTPEAITVGATDQFDQRASFSNFGRCLDIYAPGVGVTSASAGNDTGAATMSGTSMATPHVAGAAALVLASHPGYTPAQVRGAIVDGVVVTAEAGTPIRLLYTGVTPAQTPVVVPQPAPPVFAPAPPAPCNVGTNDANLGVRDRGSATSVIVISGCAGKASRAARVEVHLVHPRRGDLVVELVAPNGSAKRLKAANKRDAGHNVDAVWTVNLSARNKNGAWKLRIRDSYKANAGYLDRWTLTV
jgi:subtilisin family serine protease